MPLSSFFNKQKSKFSNYKNGNPSEKLNVIGVTGTRGKTVVTHLLYHLLKNAGLKVGFLSTIGYSEDMQDMKNDLNANFIESGELHDLLGRMSEVGMDYAVIEMPSINLKQNKYEGISLDSGLITNIIGDDGNNFLSWNDYAQSKLAFINKIKDHGTLIVNQDEKNSMDWLTRQEPQIKQDIFLYPATNSSAILQKNSLEGLQFNFEGNQIATSLVPRYNVLNTIQALKLAQSYSQQDNLHRYTETFVVPSGRMEVVMRSPVTIVIDYAYTPQMVEESLSELFQLKSPNAKIISVYGSAGDRDKSRRTIGLSSMKYSHMSILTSEDPKSEKVYDINSEIYSYVEQTGGVMVERFGSQEEYQMINKENLFMRIDRVLKNGDHPFVAFDADDYTSRLDAIHFAINYADEGDIIYITGKGHESSLAFKGVEYEWSDHEAVKIALQNQEIPIQPNV